MKAGGTLVVNVEAVGKNLPDSLLGIVRSGEFAPYDMWVTGEGEGRSAAPYRVARAKLVGAEVLASAAGDAPLVTRNKVGNGAVITVLVPRGLGLDERAHPVLPYLMNGLTQGLLPVEVRTAEGKRPAGEILYQVNRTKDGFVVLLMNNRGVDKTQNGVARVDRRQSVEIVVRSALPIRVAKELTGPRELTFAKLGDTTEIRVTVHPGDVQVVGLVTR